MYAQMVDTGVTSLSVADELSPEERAFEQRIDADHRLPIERKAEA